MKLNKKYLLASGCSYTEGHKLGNESAWPKFLGEELGLEVINLAKGGSGNEWIVQDTISYSTLNLDIAKNSLFVIQLSECLRHLVHFDLIPNSYGDLTKEGRYYNITPGLFLGQGGFLTDDRPTGCNDDALHRTIQKGSKYLVHFYCNITFALLKTYWNIINFVNFCEGNDYPYLIFDGLNSHMVKKQDNKWILPNTDPNSKSEEELQIKVGDANDIAEINEDMIEYIENLKYYYTDTTMWSFVIGNDDSDEYHKGNNNHPNKLGAQMWAKHLTKVLKEKISE